MRNLCLFLSVCLAVLFSSGESVDPIWINNKALESAENLYYVGTAESARRDFAVAQARENALQSFLKDIEVNIAEYRVITNIQVSSDESNYLRENITQESKLETRNKKITVNDLKQKDFYIRRDKNNYTAYVLLEISKNNFKKLEQEWIQQADNAYQQAKSSLKEKNKLIALKKYINAGKIIDTIPNKYTAKARNSIAENRVHFDLMQSICVWPGNNLENAFAVELAKNFDGYIFTENKDAATFVLTIKCNYEILGNLTPKRVFMHGDIGLSANGLQYQYADSVYGFGNAEFTALQDATVKLAQTIAADMKGYLDENL
ncbi:MAG: hypothetical protein LBK68_06300 [Candidatus Margulisbacteria bacterium]|jgi:hypothetical protein|nr:hypothetical protein [Candidatus Margulisiibacteriota bacterium]